MAAITKEYHFEAKHFLPNHKGKCAREHGHSYIAIVTLQAPIRDPNGQDSDSGMVVDFDDVDQAMEPLLKDYLDHWDLNETLDIPRTTAEMIALWIFKAILRNSGLPIMVVEVKETAKASAAVSMRDVEQWGHLCQVPQP